MSQCSVECRVVNIVLGFVLSQKGKPQLIHNGFLYSVHSKSSCTIYWRYVQYFNCNCPARIKTTSMRRSGDINGDDNPEHSHAPKPSLIEVRKVVSKCKQAAIRTRDATANIIALNTSNVSDEVAMNLPPESCLGRIIRNVRANSQPRPPTPEDLESLVIPELFTKTNRREQFLLHDSGGASRVLILSTIKNLEILAKSNSWACDGTFWIVPSTFCQLYTVHGWCDGALVALVYSLTPSKAESFYVHFFEVLKQHEPRLQPRKIMIDSEPGAIVAIEAAFPESEVQGYYFHFCQCI